MESDKEIIYVGHIRRPSGQKERTEIGPRGGGVFNVWRELVRRFGMIFLGSELGHSVL